MLDHRVRQTSIAVDGWHAFDTPSFAPPLLAPQAVEATNSPDASATLPGLPGSSSAVSEHEVPVQEPRQMSVVEFLETEELEDDSCSNIPRALAVNLPSASAVDSRYAMYSLRELPCVTAEEIQEI